MQGLAAWTVVAAIALAPMQRALASEVTIAVDVEASALPAERAPDQAEVVVRDDGKPDGTLMARHVAGRTSEGGWSFVWSGLPAGSYRVFLEGPWGSRWHTEIVEFSDFGRRPVDLDVLQFRGRIRKGGEPLEDVLLWFGGLNGARRIVCRSREGGRFEGFLPKREDWGEDAGRWVFQVTPAPACDPCEGDWRSGDWGDFDPRQAVAGGMVEVVEGSDGVARVDIDLGDGRISGRVVRLDAERVGADGVAAARVELEAGERWLVGWSEVTSEDGSFEFAGVPDGVVSLEAQAYVDDQFLRSDQIELRISEKEAVEELELVLKRQKRIRFFVRSHGSGVAGAVAVVRYTDPSRGEVRRRSLTAPDGSVSFWLPPSTELVQLVVHAEGLGTDGWRGSTSSTGAIEVQLSDARGDLLLPGSAGRRNAKLISSRGVVMHASTLRANGKLYERAGASVVRDLAPGLYSWCPERGECIETTVIADTLNEIRSSSDR